MDSQSMTNIIIIVITILVFLIYLLWQIKKKGLKEFVIDMILEAEKNIENGKNSEKMHYVISAIKSVLYTTKIGAFLSMFVTDENIEKFIQEVFDGLKKALDYEHKLDESGDK